MADKALFVLDAEERWRLAYDQHQWVIQRRKQNPRISKTGRPDDGYRPRSYINGHKGLLWRMFRELDILLTDEAIAQVDALPDSFLAFLKQHAPKLARNNPAIKFALREAA